VVKKGIPIYQPGSLDKYPPFWAVAFKHVPPDKGYVLEVYGDDNPKPMAKSKPLAAVTRAANGSLTIDHPLDNETVCTTFMAYGTTTEAISMVDGLMECPPWSYPSDGFVVGGSWNILWGGLEPSTGYELTVTGLTSDSSSDITVRDCPIDG
jgi:hypothetical protein